jgi:endonuclease YncB( thermonuclease family)
MEVLKSKLVIFLCIPLIFLFVVDSFPITRSFKGKCEKVIDGDTVVVDGRVIRLGGIDAPEISQYSYDGEPIGKWSKNFLQKMIEGKVVKVTYEKKGRYKRYIGTIWFQNININHLMLKMGFAMSYLSVHKFKAQNLEYLARIKRLGMYSTIGFDRPAFYRKKSRNKLRP